ncbi:endopeptidase La [uncultured Eubacterium sp.]|uniref:endopeptidase La n=1 Tax=uncultured Eubacterium sp. TaxID=165185 RepID=UPI0026003A10|nr:endopeptidase La [uncultured Eubacterium sp.]
MLVLPVYDLLLLPGVTFYFKKDILERLKVEKVEKGEEILFLIQKEEKRREDLTVDDFQKKGLVGTVENIDDDGNLSIRVHDRVDISGIELENGEFMADAAICTEIADLPEEDAKKMYKETRDSLLQFVNGFQWGVWARAFIQHWNTMTEIICAISGYLSITPEEKYEIIATDSEKDRVELMQKAIYEFIEMAHVSDEAESAQKETHERVYRESALKKQIEFLQQQLDEMHPENISDVRKFEKKIQESGMNEEALREAEKVLNRMKQEGKDSHEYGLLYDYLDFMTSLNWQKATPEEIDLNHAEQVLDEQHYGLKKVKERIVEQIAVMALNKKQSGSILLFVGAPGTGKTSICQSIAKALNREYVRISLGGVRDEAEIRGHRRTYIGAMPGRIMEGIKRSGSSNPVMVLDEVDKLSHDYNGDPASALLEVLDPEQNFSFTDHYMNVPYDLSDVLFICTANSIDTIPEPLLNRMEVIQFPGYTAVEKFEIARNYLLPNAMKTMGLKKQNLKVTDDAMNEIISEYTMESGVRGLKKKLETLCRQAAVKLVKGEQKSITVGVKRLKEFLGRKQIHHDVRMQDPQAGVVTGLAWTSAGGEILFIETSRISGDGKVRITGQLGDVMKESVQIAMTLVKSMFPKEAEKLNESDIHIHVPAGAVPKDGPSAGITIVTALTSMLLEKSISPEIAMTGEVSLRGGVMPIGGLPEKLMAAQRAGIKTVFIPYDNREELEDVAEEVKAELNIIPVKRVEEVLKETGLTE